MTKQSVVSKLDDGLDMIFRSRNQQIMLSRLHENRDFSGVLKGDLSIQVITSNKKMFSATMEALDDTHSQYLILPQGERPAIHVDDSLLLLIQTQGTTAVSQVMVTSVVGAKLRIVGVDPRKNVRYKSRIAASYRSISRDCLRHLLGKDWTIVRNTIHLDSFLEPMSGNVSLVRDYFTEDGENPCSDYEVFGTNPRCRALMVDISDKGFALLTREKLDIEALRSNMFVSVDLVLPHVVNDFRLTVVAAVRHVRNWKNDVTALHCMFVESLPSSFIVI